MSYYGESKQRKQEGVWHYLNRLLAILIVFAVITLIICAFLPELRREREQVSRLEELKKEIEAEKAVLSQRTQQVDLLKNDRGYVEVLARDRLDLMKEGETVFRLEPPARASSAKQPMHAQ